MVGKALVACPYCYGGVKPGAELVDVAAEAWFADIPGGWKLLAESQRDIARRGARRILVRVARWEDGPEPEVVEELVWPEDRHSSPR